MKPDEQMLDLLQEIKELEQSLSPEEGVSEKDNVQQALRNYLQQLRTQIENQEKDKKLRKIVSYVNQHPQLLSEILSPQTEPQTLQKGFYLQNNYSSFTQYPNPEEKDAFHRHARKLFKDTAAELEKQDLVLADIRSNKGGIAVSGEIYLYMIPSTYRLEETRLSGLVCQISQSCISGNHRDDQIILMARSQEIDISNKRVRSCGQGGLNHYASPRANIQPRHLADWLYSIYFFKLPQHASQDYVIESLGSEIPYQKSLF